MPAIVRRQDQAKRTIADDVAEIGREVRLARISHGLSQSAVAKAARCSPQAVHRVEQAAYAGHWRVWAQICAAVGLKLRASVFQEGDAVRDTAHLALLEDLHDRVAPTIGWSTEVPLPRQGDPRSWDAFLRVGRETIGVEAETRPADVQELLRRLAMKQRDGGVDHVILLLRDTRHVQRLLREHGSLIRTSFSLTSDAVLEALRDGRSPGVDSVVLLPTRRQATMHAPQAVTRDRPRADAR